MMSDAIMFTRADSHSERNDPFHEITYILPYRSILKSLPASGLMKACLNGQGSSD